MGRPVTPSLPARGTRRRKSGQHPNQQISPARGNAHRSRRCLRRSCSPPLQRRGSFRIPAVSAPRRAGPRSLSSRTPRCGREGPACSVALARAGRGLVLSKSGAPASRGGPGRALCVSDLWSPMDPTGVPGSDPTSVSGIPTLRRRSRRGGPKRRRFRFFLPSRSYSAPVLKCSPLATDHSPIFSPPESRGVRPSPAKYKGGDRSRDISVSEGSGAPRIKCDLAK